MVSCLLFKSLRHSEFIFAYGIRECPDFIDLYVAFQLFQHHWPERILSIVYSFFVCQRLIDRRHVGLFLGFLFSSIDPCFCFSLNTMLF